MRIKHVHSLEILDSRGFPTLKTYVVLDNGMVGNASVPSGASTGSHEAIELRDQDPKQYQGKGVLKALHNVETELAPLLMGKDPTAQQALDEAMIAADGTENKERLGANAILSVSLALARAGALAQGKELYEYLSTFFGTTSYTLPVPLINVVNGGKHAAESSDLQEYMLIPYGFPKFSEALRASVEVFHTLKKKIAGAGYPTTVGDEGGFAPHVKTNEEPLQFLIEAIEESNYMPSDEFGLGIDAAATEFYTNGNYRFATTQQDFSSSELQRYYENLADQYPLVSFEDIFAEDDWEQFAAFTKRKGGDLQIIGDDLYVTNTARLKRGITEHATNAILVKLNQIGTLTETIAVMQQATEHDMHAIVSHRSGETEDTFIADLCVAAGTGQIKTGSVSRSERLAKYNRLLEIEHREKSSSYAQFPFIT